MSRLAIIQTGKTNLPPRIVIHGTEGIGKSTLAKNAPSPIFLPTEDGLGEIDCDSFPLAKAVSEVEDNIRALLQEDHEYKTAVIDTADWLELLIWDGLCKKYGCDNIEQVDGGYARGYKHALTPWRHILEGLDLLREQKGMGIILLAHTGKERQEDPEHPAYDKHAPRLHKYSTALITEWADAVLFATRKVIMKTEDAGFGKERATASGLGKDGGERVLRCIGSPSCTAKNRYNLPYEMALDWQTLAAAIEKGRKE
jgi:hypothetical protein